MAEKSKKKNKIFEGEMALMVYLPQAPSVNGDDSNDEEVEEEEIIEEEAEEEADDASSSSTEVIIVRKIVRKKKRTPETAKTPEKVPEVPESPEIPENSKDSKISEKVQPPQESKEIPEESKKVPDESKESPKIADSKEVDGADAGKDEHSEEQAGTAEETEEEEESADDDDGKSETERVEAKETAEAEVVPEKPILQAEIEVKDQLQVTEVPSTNGEIKQDNIKATIHEIINDIDRQITEEAVPEPSTIEKIAEPEPPKQEAPKQEPRKELEQSAPLPSVAVQPQQRIPESPPKIPPTVTSMANVGLDTICRSY